MEDKLSDPLPQCSGCGVQLQTKEIKQLGYIPVEALEKQPVICQRCFRIKNYNDASGYVTDPEQFFTMLGQIAYERCLVVNIVDIFDFEGTLIGGLQRFVGNNPVILVINKIDLLPKVSNWNKIVNWAQKQAKEQGLKVAEIILCSVKKQIGFDRVVQAIAEHRAGRDVYVVGATNVGKSTLINRLIRDYSHLGSQLTTSQYPGTTLNMIKIPLDDGKNIVDTPGVVYPHRLTELIDKTELKKLVPDKPMKPMVYQLNDQQTLFFGSYARLDFIRGDRQSFTCYVSNLIPIHRTKLEKADELYAEHRGVMLAPPSQEQLEQLPPWTRHSIRIPRDSEWDILISGLGWIKVNGRSGADLMIHAPEGVKVITRSALI